MFVIRGPYGARYGDSPLADKILLVFMMELRLNFTRVLNLDVIFRGKFSKIELFS